MEDAPDLQPTYEETLPPLLPPQLRPVNLLRDAVVDLIVVVLTGATVVLAVGLALMAMRVDPGQALSSGWGIAVLFLGTQLPLLFRGLRRRRRNRSPDIRGASANPRSALRPVDAPEFRQCRTSKFNS